LQARGLAVGTARRLLVVRDGSEAIAKAVRHFWPDAGNSLAHFSCAEAGKTCA
jgi:hypothetical protein